MPTSHEEKVIEGFGDEWSRWTYIDFDREELLKIWHAYFHIVPSEIINPDANCFDMGSGTGRWATCIAPLVKSLVCLEPSKKAFDVSKINCHKFENTAVLQESVFENSLPDNYFDFGYSLGVLHHISDTQRGIEACARKLKPGGYFLIYLYYNMDNRPYWFKFIWKITDTLRRGISKLPAGSKHLICDIIAFLIYWPVSRLSGLLSRFMNLRNAPLVDYANKPLYVLRTDSLDRFGTSLEQRFSLNEIRGMLEKAGLEPVKHSPNAPYWVVLSRKISP